MSPPKNKTIRDELILLQSLSVSNLTIHKAGCIAIDNGAVAVCRASCDDICKPLFEMQTGSGGQNEASSTAQIRK